MRAALCTISYGHRVPSDTIEFQSQNMVRVVTQESQSALVAFTDETGNSGMNLFDGNQPFFWTGTLLTPIHLDLLDPAIHQACLSRARCTELHGSHLGLGGIERVAGKLCSLFLRYQCRFLFTRIDKSHLAAMKFVDTLLDSGLNGAVSNFHYGLRFNRLYLAHILVAMLDRSDREEFWTAYAEGDSGGFRRILLRVEGRIQSRVDDPRTRQLLLDAITWATANPEPLLEGTRSALDSPNIVAMTLLVHELHALNQNSGLSIRTFIHDEQQQFGKHLETAFEVSKRFGSANATSPLAMIINLKDMATFDCGFQSTSSKTSLGLQMLDVALWITKRFVDDPDAIHGKCRELAEYITQHGYFSSFTQEAMFGEVVRGFQILNSAPLSPEKERRGRELLAKIEADRLERMQRTLSGKALPPPPIDTPS